MKKPYYKYKDTTLYEGYKLIQEQNDTFCPTGPGNLCGFPEKFIEKTMKKVQRLLAENKRLKKQIKKYENKLYESADIVIHDDIIIC